jgi:hypothetical protein
MFMNRRSFVFLIIVLLIVSYSSVAQNATGRILGTVTDQNGSVVAGANVTVTNTGTNISSMATTDAQGFYQAATLPIGNYKVTVKKQGFKTATSDENKLLINQNLRVDVKMIVGGEKEVVEVTANATGVETVDATIGQSVTDRPLVDLPLNGRNAMQLALLQPGVSESNIGGSGGGSGFSIAGGRPDSVTYLLDGGVNNNLLSNGIVYNPNPDTIQEFKVIQSNYTAEYGRNGGGIISVVTKSGSNKFHGSGFDFLRNDALNANTFFNKVNGLKRDRLKRNQYGATIGGPIVKDKLFFFFGYQGQKLTQTTAGPQVSTYTPAQLNGDFSTFNNGSPDPNVVAFLQAYPYFQPNAALAAQGKIDPTKIDAVAKKYIAANLIPTSPNGILAEQAPGTNDYNEFTFKADYNITSKDKLSITLGRLGGSALLNYSSNTSKLYPITNDQNRQFASFTYSRVINSHTLNEARFTAQRIHTIQFKPAISLPNTTSLSIGITPDLNNGPARVEFASGLTLGFSPQGPQDITNNTFIYSDTLSWSRGKHNLKFGGYFSPYQNNTVYDFYGTGDFFFYGAGGNLLGDSSVGSNGSTASGNDLADFLIGAPDEYVQFGNAPSNIRSKSTYFFAQDEWHLKSNLIITLGIRYEYSAPKFDTQGRSFSLLKGVQSTVFTNAPTGLLFPGDAKAPTGANFPDKNDWAPRFGFAWDPFKNGKTSIRGGVGFFYDILKGEDNLQFNGQAPFFGYSDLAFDTVPNGATGFMTSPYTTNAFGTPNSFPSKVPPKNLDFNAAGFLPFGGGGVYFVDPHLRTPYTMQYNLSVQHALNSRLTLDAAYVGSMSRKLTLLQDTNPFVLGTNTRTFNLVPGASFGRLYTFRNVGNADYNSLQLSARKDIGEWKSIGKTYFTLGYTWSHNIDNGSGFRNRNSQVPYYNANKFRASGDFDIRHRITFSGGWDLPFDNMWQSGPKRLTKGWSLFPIVSWRTGFPIDVFSNLQASSGSAGPSAAGDRELVRANLLGAITYYDPHTKQTFTNGCTGSSVAGYYYFNPSVFGCSYPSSATAEANPALRTYGTLVRNAMRGPNRSNFDLSFSKHTQVYESLNMEIRADFFNIFNHAEFSNPDTSITSSTFGRITTTADPRIIQLALKFTF